MVRCRTCNARVVREGRRRRPSAECSVGGDEMAYGEGSSDANPCPTAADIGVRRGLNRFTIARTDSHCRPRSTTRRSRHAGDCRASADAASTKHRPQSDTAFGLPCPAESRTSFSAPKRCDRNHFDDNCKPKIARRSPIAAAVRKCIETSI